jgi:hypothetical protein
MQIIEKIYFILLFLHVENSIHFFSQHKKRSEFSKVRGH